MSLSIKKQPGGCGRTALSGFSMIEVLLALMIVGIVTFTIIEFSQNAQHLAKSQTMGQSLSEVEQMLKSTLVAAIRADACFDPSLALQQVSLGPLGSFKFSQSIPFNLRNNGLSQLPEMSAAQWRSAITRCARPRLDGTASGQTYFCVQFSPPTLGNPPPAGTFLASDTAFAEILVQTLDLASGAPASCAAYTDPTVVAGSQIYYTFYSASMSAQGPVLKDQTFAATVAK